MFYCENSKTKHEIENTVALHEKKDSIQKPEKSLSSEITCPKCGHKKIETLPTEDCQLRYTCENCKTVLYPKEEDCCVFCTYGDKKCPSKQ